MNEQGLTQAQNDEYNKYKRELQFFDGNTAGDTYLPFKSEISDMRANLTLLESFIPDKDTGSTDITAAQAALELEIANEVAAIAAPARAYAIKYGKQALAMSTRLSADKILHLKNADVQPAVINMVKAVGGVMSDPQFASYNVTQQMIDGVVAKAAQFQGALGQHEEVAGGVGVANKNIEAQLIKLRGNERQFALLIGHFKTENPSFYNGYNAVREMPHLGVHHTGLEGNIKAKATGEAIAGAQVKNLQTGMTAVADITGSYTLTRFKSGTYEFEVSADGYKPVTILLTIRRGRILDQDFELLSN